MTVAERKARLAQPGAHAEGKGKAGRGGREGPRAGRGRHGPSSTSCHSTMLPASLETSYQSALKPKLARMSQNTSCRMPHHTEPMACTEVW